MATNLLFGFDVPIVVLSLVSFRNQLKGTVKDAAGNPLERLVTANKETLSTGLLIQRTTTSAADGSFSFSINDLQPFTLVAHGAEGENDQIFKGVRVR